MKALTVCQPYAELIARGAKLVENRTWPTAYRGPLYIHAGKSRSWLGPGDDVTYPGMPFGALVARAELYDCVRLANLPAHLTGHEHANGPWCWLLRGVERLPAPVPALGKMGIWDFSFQELGVGR